MSPLPSGGVGGGGGGPFCNYDYLDFLDK